MVLFWQLLELRIPKDITYTKAKVIGIFYKENGLLKFTVAI